MSLLFKIIWCEIGIFWLTVDMILTQVEYFASQTRLLRMLANKFNNPNEIAEHTIIMTPRVRSQTKEQATSNQSMRSL